LRLIRTAIAPLVFLCVAAGIVSAGDFRRVGKLGVVALVYFELVSTVALVLGLVAGHVLGVGRNTPLPAVAAGSAVTRGALPNAADFILNIFADNFIGAFARGELLQVLVIALIFGAAILRLSGPAARPSSRVWASPRTCCSSSSTSSWPSPRSGHSARSAFAVAASGTTVLLSLAYLVLSFYAVVIVFIVVVLGLICAAAGLNIFTLLSFMREEIYLVLGTASSESTLPRLLERLPQLGCSRQSVGLVLPTGYAFNLDGTAIFMTMSTVFLANAYRVPLSCGQELGIVAVMLLTSKGAATVSGGSFVVFVATITTTGVLPIEGLPILFGVYRFLSIGVATTNVIGNWPRSGRT
jgi:aerobic C4-dicarboxylate transport protein